MVERWVRGCGREGGRRGREGGGEGRRGNGAGKGLGGSEKVGESGLGRVGDGEERGGERWEWCGRGGGRGWARRCSGREEGIVGMRRKGERGAGRQGEQSRKAASHTAAACSISPNLVSSFAPASPPSETAHAYATFLLALTPPCSLATRMASSHRSFALYILTAEPQSCVSTWVRLTLRLRARVRC